MTGLTLDLFRKVTCELSRAHEGEHASYLEEFRADLTVWLLWWGGEFTYVCVRPCETVNPDPSVAPVRREVCELYAGHPSVHSWQLADSVPE